MAFCNPAPEPETVESVLSTDTLNEQQKLRFEQAAKPMNIAFGELESQSHHFQLDCIDCPQGIGQVLSWSIDPSHSKPARITNNCQGALIGDNRFITNRHCLPFDLREKGLSCKNRVKVLFPALDAESLPQVMGCESILDISPTTKLDEGQPQPDWVILQLDTEQDSIEVPTEPTNLPHKTELFAFVPVKKNNGSLEINPIKCTTQQNSLMLPEYQNDDSPVILLHCEQDITKGYSGSMLYQDIDDQWVPVASLSHVWGTQKKSENIIINKKAIASSLACLPLYGDNEVPENCAFHPKRKKKLKQQLIIKALKRARKKIKKQMEPYLEDSHNFAWEELNLESDSELPAHVQNFWEQLQAKNYGFIKQPGKKALMRTLSPLVPKCIQPESAPNFKTNENFTASVPMVQLTLYRSSHGQVRVQGQVRHQKVQLVSAAGSPEGHFTFLPVAGPGMKPHPRAILSQQFKHNGAVLPICDK